MEMLKKRDMSAPQAKVLVLPIGMEQSAAALSIATELRSSGIRTCMDTRERKLKKSLATAAAKGIRFVILIGNEEEVQGRVRLKDMREATERVMDVQEAIYVIEKSVAMEWW